MHDGDQLLPKLDEFKAILRDSETLSNMTPSSFVNMRLTGKDDIGADQEIVSYINQILKVDRLVFCPLVRSFLRFDNAVDQGDKIQAVVDAEDFWLA